MSEKDIQNVFLPGDRTGNQIVDGRFLKETAFGSQFSKKITASFRGEVAEVFLTHLLLSF